jgi:hypothetical protein
MLEDVLVLLETVIVRADQKIEGRVSQSGRSTDSGALIPNGCSRGTPRVTFAIPHGFWL